MGDKGLRSVLVNSGKRGSTRLPSLLLAPESSIGCLRYTFIIGIGKLCSGHRWRIMIYLIFFTIFDTSDLLAAH